ncbi:MAG: FIST C-terminal domain-containing protein [Alphaproteobacteria bacterium]
MSAGFAVAFAEGDTATLGERLRRQLPDGQRATLGVLYVSEPAGAALPRLVRELTEATGTKAWAGGVGLGICTAGREVHDRPAAALLLADLPPDGFRLFGATADPAADLPRLHAGWIETVAPPLALVHGDPRCPDLLRATADAAAASSAFLVGGLMSHNSPQPLLAGHIAGRQDDASLFGAAGLSGLLLAPEIAVATGLTQGCMPIGPVRRIDEARDNVLMTIDGRPALACFYDDIGPELARDPRRLGGLIFAGLPVPGSDTGDYLVRNLMAIDPRQGWLAIAEEVAPGDQILFCRRDPDSARADLVRMLRQLKNRLPGPPRAGIYVSCIARGAALFGETGVETGLIRETLGDIPLIGFFANGEISRDRLYGHTGVLTVFT